jgi:hypothetical protein
VQSRFALVARLGEALLAHGRERTLERGSIDDRRVRERLESRG